jgi:hypothetical protein
MSSARWTPAIWDEGIRPAAVITGASSGIGAEFARQMAAAGMGLVLVARRRQRLEQLGETLARAYGVPVEVEVRDLAERQALEALARMLAARCDVDLLVNNAGFGLIGRFERSDPDRQVSQLDVHITASVRLTRAVLPQMVSRRRGAIVQVSSLAGMIPRLSSPTYGPSKAFLNAFSYALEGEIAGSGVCLQALCPGFTLTEFHSTPEYAGLDVHDRIPGFLWLSAEQVVRESLAGLAAGRSTLIPGSRYRWLALAGRSSLLQSIAVRWRAARRRRTNPPAAG